MKTQSTFSWTRLSLLLAKRLRPRNQSQSIIYQITELRLDTLKHKHQIKLKKKKWTPVWVSHISARNRWDMMIRFRHMQRILSEDYKRQDKLHRIRVNTGPANTLAILISYHYKTNLKSFLNISCTPKHQTSYNLPRTQKEVFSHLRVHVCFHPLLLRNFTESAITNTKV